MTCHSPAGSSQSYDCGVGSLQRAVGDGVLRLASFSPAWPHDEHEGFTSPVDGSYAIIHLSLRIAILSVFSKTI